MNDTSPMTNTAFKHSLLLIVVVFLTFFSKTSSSANTLYPNQTLADNQTLVSTNQRFELGFFSPGSSKNRYLGIWYKDISPLTVAWVANRNSPVTDSTGVLKMDDKGILQVLNDSGSVFWSTVLPKQGTATVIAEKPIIKFLDSGNLVVMEEGDDDNEENYQWQSFDDFTDTLLPGMKLGWDLERGVNNSIVSWKSAEDPSPGEYSFTMEHFGSPEIYLLNKQTPIYRSGPWNGIQFSGVPEMMSDDGFVYSFVLNDNQKYYKFEVNESIISRLVVDASGKIRRSLWLDSEKGWISYWDAPKDQCDQYKVCGPYGICNSNDSPVCTCVKGFEPRFERDWFLRDGSGGCVERSNYTCGKDDGFLKMKNMKLPDCSKAYYNRSMNLEKCRDMCKKNCSCTAYANSDIGNGGSGCINWIGELVDLRQYAKGGQDLYVRLAASELGNNHKKIVTIVTVAVIFSVLVLGFTCWIIWKKRIQNRNSQERVARVKSQELPLSDMFMTSSRDPSEEHKNADLELHLIDFDIIAATTNYFSIDNKLGEGGFGSVYKGTLADGQQIAVKRLSKTSGQGVDEFKNEVMLIAKLQHRNLVRLLGCCISGEEKMLIYEYMSNKSLDSFLFDKRKSSILEWKKRFNIIMGIARGLLYLHQDSRFRIIHRDLKASNILLDDEMTPKISDFGMARIFGGNQTEANTRRVVGTYGYMAPEYAMDGLFSVKSDVFSFGVLILEILSGKKNRGFYSASNELNLLGHAWRLWEDEKGLDLLDESLAGTYAKSEVLKCLHIGLLCVQEHADDRPNISSVVLMLSSETVALGQPKQPGFSLTRTPTGPYSSSNDQETGTVNNITITVLDPR